MALTGATRGDDDSLILVRRSNAGELEALRKNGCSAAFLWFPEEVDRRSWEKMFGRIESDHLVVSAGPDTLILSVQCGTGATPWLNHAQAQVLMYLPSTGLSADWVKHCLPTRGPRLEVCFFRIMTDAELRYSASDGGPPLRELHGHVEEHPRRDVHSFFGAHAEKEAETLSAWLSLVVHLVTIKARIRTATRRLATLELRARRLVRAMRATGTSRMDRSGLQRLLASRAAGRLVLAQIRESHRALETDKVAEADTRSKADAIAASSYQRTLSRCTRYECGASGLGDELAPTAIQLGRRLHDFSAKLCRHHVEALRDLGRQLEEAATETAPLLALVGPFSSGKTTLLNALLGGTFRFKTAWVANTALLLEVASAKDEDSECAEFIPRDHVEHVLLGRDDQDEPESTLERNLDAIADLVDREILYEPELRYVPDVSNKAQPGRPARRPRDRGRGTARIEDFEVAVAGGKANVLARLRWIRDAGATALDSRSLIPDRGPRTGADSETQSKISWPRVAKVVFKARVSADAWRNDPRLAVLLAPIDLQSPTGRSVFCGGASPDDKPLIENPIVSFLVKKAEVRLHRQILAHTRIADTPGTGSRNDRHDVITHECLRDASAFLVFLPSKQAKSSRAYEILERLRERIGVPEDGALLRNVAFIVNCFSQQSEEEQKRQLRDYEATVRRKFWSGAGRQSGQMRYGFFVLNLGEVLGDGLNPDTLHGLPSMRPFRQWVSCLFAQGQVYRDRYERCARTLEEAWRKSRQALEERRRRLRNATEDEREGIAALRTLVEGADTLRMATDEASGALRQLVLEVTSEKPGTVSRQLAAASRRYEEECASCDAVQDYCAAVCKAFETLNEDVLPELREVVARWTDATNARLEECSVHWEPPPLPDPADQRPRWSGHGKKFDTTPIVRARDMVLKKWPRGLARFWDGVREFFGAKSVFTEFYEDLSGCVSEYFNEVSVPFRKYAERCIEMMLEACAVGEEKCRAEIDRRERSSDATERERMLAEVESQIAAFNSLERDRCRLRDRVRDLLAKGDD